MVQQPPPSTAVSQPLRGTPIHFRTAFRIGLFLLAFGLGDCASASAQLPIQIRGRIEDAHTGQPVAGATVLATDSTRSTLTDSVGRFAIALADDDSLAVLVRRIGYLPQRFDLPAGAKTALSVLRLEPQVLVLDGVTVTTFPAVVELQKNLMRRRNFFPGAIRFYDTDWIERFGPVGGSALDLVRRSVPLFGPCESTHWAACVPGRYRSIQYRSTENRYLVCINRRASIDPIAELSSMDIESIAQMEILVRSRVTVYTREWMITSAENGKLTVPSLLLGC